ncbi:MAG: hypothetical protein N4A33_08015 [Bacteriovoracaceae bacterium]|nr:hypothetical protein [Bacteriovoracaceae bacterium]
MKITLFFFVVIVVSSCEVKNSRNSSHVENSKYKYLYKDYSGSFILERIVKHIRNDLVTKTTIYDTSSKPKVLETSTVAYSKKKERLYPKIAFYKIWFDKKKYSSRFDFDENKLLATIKMNSPEKKWQGIQSMVWNKNEVFCWFSSLVECVKYHGLLKDNKLHNINIIWDSFPYVHEQLTRVNFKKAITKATFQYDSNFKMFKRYELSIGNQVIYYFFTKEYEFKRMYWISQGISLERK